jgi:hypothetical protein
MREEMILSRSLKMEKMLALLGIAGDLFGILVAAGFKAPPSRHGRHADCSVPIRPERIRGSMTERDGSVGQTG